MHRHENSNCHPAGKAYFWYMTPLQQRYKKQSPGKLIMYLLLLLLIIILIIAWNSIQNFFSTFFSFPG
jgi:hypothetical protein